MRYYFSGSFINFQDHTWAKNRRFESNLSKITRPVTAIKSLRFALFPVFTCSLHPCFNQVTRLLHPLPEVSDEACIGDLMVSLMRGKENIYGKPRVSTKQEKIGWITRGIMLGAIANVHKRGNMSLPISFLLLLKSSQHLQECAIESLTLAISHWVVWCGTTLLHPTEGTELFDDLFLEVPTLVAVQTSWKPVVHKEVVVKNLSCCPCCLVPRGIRLGIFGEMVCHY